MFRAFVVTFFVFGNTLKDFTIQGQTTGGRPPFARPAAITHQTPGPRGQTTAVLSTSVILSSATVNSQTTQASTVLSTSKPLQITSTMGQINSNPTTSGAKTRPLTSTSASLASSAAASFSNGGQQITKGATGTQTKVHSQNTLTSNVVGISSTTASQTGNKLLSTTVTASKPSLTQALTVTPQLPLTTAHVTSGISTAMLSKAISSQAHGTATMPVGSIAQTKSQAHGTATMSVGSIAQTNMPMRGKTSQSASSTPRGSFITLSAATKHTIGAVANSSTSASRQEKGLSSGEKIAIGMGVAAGLLLISTLGLGIWATKNRSANKVQDFRSSTESNIKAQLLFERMPRVSVL